ncbi:MAG: glycosyltransferase [Steroidobacteraceae bacterium]
MTGRRWPLIPGTVHDAGGERSSPDLPVINMFWFGAPLSRVETLSIASFLAHGHPVDLYVYDDIGAVPAGATLRDAARILPQALLFRHRRTGSVAHFADWFRYKVLFEVGGIWADTDVICLQPLVYDDPVVFAWETEQYLNSAVLGLPAGHPLAAWLAASCEQPNKLLPYDSWRMRLRKVKRRYLQGDRRDRTRWGETGPKGLTHAARHFGLLARALPSWHFYPVAAEQWRTLFEAPRADAPLDFGASRAVHVWNNMMHTQAGFDKNARFADDSSFERLWQRYLGTGTSSRPRL